MSKAGIRFITEVYPPQLPPHEPRRQEREGEIGKEVGKEEGPVASSIHTITINEPTAALPPSPTEL